ncbi:MAG: FABP family protein [Actinomycetota bacterium]
MDTPKLHPACAPIAFLLGTWRGEGKGEYPTIQRFSYGEEIRFHHIGKPFLIYEQRTWSLDGDMPMHVEAGYWRPKQGGRIEIVLAHPTGVAEIQEGTFSDGLINVRSLSVTETSSAKNVTALARRFRVDANTMTYEVDMAAVGQPLIHHLGATLTRIP